MVLPPSGHFHSCCLGGWLTWRRTTKRSMNIHSPLGRVGSLLFLFSNSSVSKFCLLFYSSSTNSILHYYQCYYCTRTWTFCIPDCNRRFYNNFSSQVCIKNVVQVNGRVYTCDNINFRVHQQDRHENWSRIEAFRRNTSSVHIISWKLMMMGWLYLNIVTADSVGELLNFTSRRLQICCKSTSKDRCHTVPVVV